MRGKGVTMITTPFGTIKVYRDDVALDYEAAAHVYDRPPVKGHPIAGCCRICVPVGTHRSICCELELNDLSIPETGDSGQGYLNAEFTKGTVNLRIGAEDENPAFETVRTAFGMEYRIHEPVDEVVFGVAWATDYEGSFDCRTWYAADPTLDGERSST